MSRAVLFIVLHFALSVGHAHYEEYPNGCGADQYSDCAIWSVEKASLKRSGAFIFSSKNSFYQISGNRIHLVRGQIWAVAGAKSLVVSSSYGDVLVPKKGHLWAGIETGQFLVRALKTPVKIQPIGYKREVAILPPGFETRLSFVKQETGKAEYQIPTVINLREHLRVFGRVFPYHYLDYKEAVYALGKSIQKATAISAHWHKSLAERKIAMVIEERMKRKELSDYRRRIDSYLRRLFKEKNNFEEP